MRYRRIKETLRMPGYLEVRTTSVHQSGRRGNPLKSNSQLSQVEQLESFDFNNSCDCFAINLADHFLEMIFD